MRRLLIVVLAALAWPAAAQVGSPVPSTAYTRSFLRSADSNAALVVLGIVSNGVTQVTNWITSIQGGSTGTNLVLGGVTTNWGLLQYPEPLRGAAVRGPRLYYFWQSSGPAVNEEPNLMGLIEFMSTNAVPYGVNEIHVDAGPLARDGEGNLIFSTANFPTQTAQAVLEYAHQRGVVITFYVDVNGSPQGGVTSRGYEVQDARQLAAWGAHGIKIDVLGTSAGPGLDSFQRAALMSSAFSAASRSPVRRQASSTMHALVPRYFDSDYSAGSDAGVVDTTSGYQTGTAWQQIYLHFVNEVTNLAFVGPQFSLEGAGWMKALGYAGKVAWQSAGYAWPWHSAMDLSAMTCSSPMLYGQVTSDFAGAAITNLDYLGILRDPFNVPARIVLTNTSNGSTNYILVRPLGGLASGTNAVCFYNTSTNSLVMSLNFTNALGLGTNAVFTAYDPWWTYGSAGAPIAGYYTNTITVTNSSTNTILYRVVNGFWPPAFSPGTNYLSDWPVRSTLVAPSGGFNSFNRDQRSSSSGLNIGGTTFSKGLIMGYGADQAATSAEWTLGGKASIFQCTFGQHYDWTNFANTSERLTVYGDGVQLYQSAYIKDVPAAVSVNVSGVSVLKLAVDCQSTSYGQGVLGNAAVVVPTYGVFAGDGSLLNGVFTLSTTNLGPVGITNSTAAGNSGVVLEKSTNAIAIYSNSVLVAFCDTNGNFTAESLFGKLLRTNYFYSPPLFNCWNSAGSILRDSADVFGPWTGTPGCYQLKIPSGQTWYLFDWPIPREALIGTNIDVMVEWVTAAAASPYTYGCRIGCQPDAGGAGALTGGGSYTFTVGSGNNITWTTNNLAFGSTNANVHVQVGSGGSSSPIQADIANIIVNLH